jgi:uncharacterized protein (TIGR03086 family)
MTAPVCTETLLLQAIRYALGTVANVAPRALARPTPCAEWDLAELLRHVNDSLTALHEVITTRTIGLDPTEHTTEHTTVPASDPIDTFRERASDLLAAAATLGQHDRLIAIADRCATESVVAAVGTVELAVHGWDVATACGIDQPIPPGLASGVLEIVPLVVTDAIRVTRFAPPVTVSVPATPSDRLVALLGRCPRISALGPAN